MQLQDTFFYPVSDFVVGMIVSGRLHSRTRLSKQSNVEYIHRQQQLPTACFLNYANNLKGRQDIVTKKKNVLTRRKTITFLNKIVLHFDLYLFILVVGNLQLKFPKTTARIFHLLLIGPFFLYF